MTDQSKEQIVFDNSLRKEKPVRQSCLFKLKNLKPKFTFKYWVEKFIDHQVNTRKVIHQNMINSNSNVNAIRYHIFRYDEYWDKNFGLINGLPWWCPFNILLHNWVDGDKGYLHDHPRWSITIVLSGALIEETPEKHKWLTTGSIVVRSHKFIHRIIVPEIYKGKTWTLFIVGRRKYKQSYYNSRGNLIEGYPETFPISEKEIK